MISLKPLIELIKIAPPTFAMHREWFRMVGGAAEFAKINPDRLPLPAAWIVRAADKVKHAGERSELLTLSFDVVIAIENVREHGDGETDDVLLAYRRAVCAQLEGYPIDGTCPIRFAGGQVLEYTDGDLYWRDRYEFETIYTNYLPDPTPPFDSIVKTGENL